MWIRIQDKLTLGTENDDAKKWYKRTTPNLSEMLRFSAKIVLLKNKILRKKIPARNCLERGFGDLVICSDVYNFFYVFT